MSDLPAKFDDLRDAIDRVADIVSDLQADLDAWAATTEADAKTVEDTAHEEAHRTIVNVDDPRLRPEPEVAVDEDNDLGLTSAELRAGLTEESGLKPLIRGLIDRTRIPRTYKGGNYRDAVRNRVIEAYGFDFNPDPGKWDFSKIDLAIEASMKAGMEGARLRVFGGRNAPQHVKGFGSMPLYRIGHAHHKAGIEEEVPVWWKGPYLDWCDDVMHRLSVRYDDHPFIRDVTIGLGGLVWAEPTIRETGYRDDNGRALNREIALANGWTKDAEIGFHHHQFDVAANSFPHTRYYWPVTQMQWSGLNQSGDLQAAFDFGNYGRDVLGERLIIGQNSIQWLPDKYATRGTPNWFGQVSRNARKPRIYEDLLTGILDAPMRTDPYAIPNQPIGWPISLQTLQAKLMPDDGLVTTLEWALAQPACVAVELPGQYYKKASVADLARIDEAFWAKP